MKIEDVPQDCGMIGEFGTEVCYAVNDAGSYELVASLGWNPKNVVNDQAWDLIIQDVKIVYDKVGEGALSPLVYHMTCCQMDRSLLAKYVSMAGWRVKRHFKPHVFKKLSQSVLARYAEAFGITVEELKNIPDRFDPKVVRNR